MVAEASGEISLDVMARPSQRRRAAMAFALLLIVAAGTLALFLIGGFEQQLRDVVHTYDVREEAHDLAAALRAAESGQRSYVLTGEPANREPYEDALEEIEDRLSTLLALTSDTPAQHARVAALQLAIERKLAELRRATALIDQGRASDAQDLVQPVAQGSIMQAVGADIDAFVAAEDQSLTQRNVAVSQTREAIFLVTLLALGGAVFLAFALFSRSQRRVSDLARSRNRLRSKNELLEARVRERTAELEDARHHAERERQRVEALLQDTNHRIGNSLSTVSSLLALQALRAESADVRDALEAARLRVHTIASGHRRLRLGDDLESAELEHFLDAVVTDLRNNAPAGKRLAVETSFVPAVVHARDATTLGILLGELITNALKHAFPGERSGTIWARLGRDDSGVLVLSVEDDGIGIDPERAQTSAGFGTMIMQQLARQFDGTPEFAAREGGGTRVQVHLPGLTILSD